MTSKPHSIQDDVRAIEAAIEVDWYGPNPAYRPTVAAGREALGRLVEQLEAYERALHKIIGEFPPWREARIRRSPALRGGRPGGHHR